MKHITLNKNYDIQVDDKVLNYYDPDYVFIPFNIKNLSKKQDEDILINEQIMKNNDLVCSSVSGKIIGIKKCLVKNKNTSCLVIQNNFKEKKVKNINRFHKYNIDNILNAIEKFGNDKLLEKLKKSNKFSNIIINTINDEPYCHNNIVNFKDNIKDILELIDLLAFIYKNNTCNLIIKENDTLIIEKSLNIIAGYPNINMILVKDEYLLEKEGYLFDYLKIDSNDALYLTIDELLFIVNATKYNKISDTKLVTICGNAIKKSIIVKSKKYVLLNDLVSKYIKIKDKNYNVVINGLMSGYECSLDNLILTDDINAIFIMKDENKKVFECTKCGKCIDICPLHINIFSHNSLKKCINCGLCSYICPSRIDLKKYIKENK